MGYPIRLPAAEDSEAAHWSLHLQTKGDPDKDPKSLIKLAGAPGQAPFHPSRGLLRPPPPSEALAVTAPPEWVCPRGRPRPNPLPSGLDGGGRLPRSVACPPHTPTPRGRLDRPWVGAFATAPPGGGPRAAPGVGEAPRVRQTRRSDPARPRPGLTAPRPPARCRGTRTLTHAAFDPAPAGRAAAAGPATHSPRELGGRRGRACAPRATQSDGPGAARRRRVGTGSAAAAAGPRPRPRGATSGHAGSSVALTGGVRGGSGEPRPGAPPRSPGAPAPPGHPGATA